MTTTEVTSSSSSTATTLTPGQAHALLDILTHRELYTAEIELFKTPGVILSYGPPFQDATTTSKTPLLQKLFNTFIVPIPGLRDLGRDFWTTRLQVIIEDLAKANLSESYDKGSMGIRKMFSTAISAIIEYPARGLLGGTPGKGIEYDPDRVYDMTSRQDLVDGWWTFVRQIVYGDLLEELFEKTAKSDRLEDHSQMVIAAHQHIVINLGSLLHYILVASPKGPSFLSLVEKAHNQIPYRLIRNVLKIGNAASMINGMVKLVLAKMSVGMVTNWVGWSSGADEGMNLLQQIISIVIHSDIKNFEARVVKIEKAKLCPKEHLTAIVEYTKLSRNEQENYRTISRTSSTSMVHVILTSSPSNPSTDITPEQHAQLLDYLSFNLSIRDREEIVRVLCKSNPDNLTAAIRELVAIYDPIIRNVHAAVDLSGTLSDFERFLNDTIKTTKITDPSRPPSVEDCVSLLERHQKSVHVFLHQFCKNGAAATELWKDYALYAAKKFRQQEGAVEGGGSFTDTLEKMIQELSADDRAIVIDEMEMYENYLRGLSMKTDKRMEAVVSVTSPLEPKKPTKRGPGNFLFKWQELLDSTVIGPAEATGGTLRRGRDSDVKDASKVDADGSKKGLENGALGGSDRESLASVGSDKLRMASEPPGVNRTVALLLPRFKEVLATSEY